MQIIADVQSCGYAAIHNAQNGARAMRQQLSNFKAEFFKALAHPLRISILDALREGELTVNEISQRFAVEPANASQQLAVLRNKNIVVTRKDGASVYYSVSDKSIFKLLDVAKEIFSHHLVGVRSMLEEIHAPGVSEGARVAGRKRIAGSRP
jgi:DNA-binding transcriptional ArsR family regulator